VTSFANGLAKPSITDEHTDTLPYLIYKDTGWILRADLWWINCCETPSATSFIAEHISSRDVYATHTFNTALCRNTHNIIIIIIISDRDISHLDSRQSRSLVQLRGILYYLTFIAYHTLLHLSIIIFCLVLVIGQPPKEYHADGLQQLHAISMGVGCIEQVSYWKRPANCFQSSPLSSCSIR